MEDIGTRYITDGEFLDLAIFLDDTNIQSQQPPANDNSHDGARNDASKVNPHFFIAGPALAYSRAVDGVLKKLDGLEQGSDV